jgi:hypothetical protein
MNTSHFVRVLLKTGLWRDFQPPKRFGVPVSLLGVPVGVPVLEHRKPMKQNDFRSVFQCSSRFREKAWRTQYLRGVDSSLAVRGSAQPQIDWNTGTPTRKSNALS